MIVHEIEQKYNVTKKTLIYYEMKDYLNRVEIIIIIVIIATMT